MKHRCSTRRVRFVDLFKRLSAAGLAAFFIAATMGTALASNVGTLRGRILDSSSQAPIANARVTIESPATSRTTTSDASGEFVFLSLNPDTYTLHASKAGYDDAAAPGVSVFADQATNYNLALAPTMRTIARVSARTSTSLVHPGTTSDVYSVNSGAIKATSAVGGSGSLNQAYGAIASVPGVNVPSNQQGWYQSVYIRGGDFDQVAYEFDGLPLTRQSDLAPIATLSSLGNQEVQVYTGGTPASSNSSGLAGYINQVIKTGTYPGYLTASLGVGAPAFYHSATVEASGSTPDRLFSYYAGLSGSNQDFRYGDQFNNVSNPLYFYPTAIPSTNSSYHILDGTCGDPTLSTPVPRSELWGGVLAGRELRTSNAIRSRKRLQHSFRPAAQVEFHPRRHSIALRDRRDQHAILQLAERAGSAERCGRVSVSASVPGLRVLYRPAAADARPDQGCLWTVPEQQHVRTRSTDQSEPTRRVAQRLFDREIPVSKEL